MNDIYTEYHEKVWGWFKSHARSRYALWWLALIALIDPIFFPIAPEIFLVALTLAHKERAKSYFWVSIICSTIGAAASYFLALFLFVQFGQPLIEFYSLQDTFDLAKHYLSLHVFLAMLLVSFTPIPDKVFIWASGFVGAPFLPFFLGYIIGRAARMALVVYVVHTYGQGFLNLINRYMLWFSGVIIALGALYAIVHLHLFGL